MIKERIEEEVRIVLLGKTGCGKSATGNTILNAHQEKSTKRFVSKCSGASVTSKCHPEYGYIFGMNIQVVDTPGIFDTAISNDAVLREIADCVRVSAPGPHCFLLVMEITRFTEEEEKSIETFFTTFGEDVTKYSIVLFTSKDKLDDDGITLKDHLENVPVNLKKILAKCNNRCIAFNNKADVLSRYQQVKDLLEMIVAIHKQNNGKYYTNDMYKKAEIIMKDRELEILLKREKEKKHEREQIKKEVSKEFKNVEEQKNELERRVAEMEHRYSKLPRPRVVAREEEMEPSFFETLFSAILSVTKKVLDLLA